MLGGFSNSFSQGDFDVYLIKTDSRGNLNWQKTLGGQENDYAYGMQVASDGGYVLGGYTESSSENGDNIMLVCVQGQAGEETSLSTIWPATPFWKTRLELGMTVSSNPLVWR